MSIGRPTLEALIRIARRTAQYQREPAGDVFGSLTPSDIDKLADAAEAHLATLPRKKWGVKVEGGGFVHFDDFASAIEAVKIEAAAGRAVTIEHRVPV